VKIVIEFVEESSHIKSDLLWLQSLATGETVVENVNANKAGEVGKKIFDRMVGKYLRSILSNRRIRQSLWRRSV